MKSIVGVKEEDDFCNGFLISTEGRSNMCNIL